MPWKETTTMEQKIEFICEWRTGKYTITELCKSFEISRPTAYKLINRFDKQGYEGLREQSRTPRKHPNETKKNIIIRMSYFWPEKPDPIFKLPLKPLYLTRNLI